MALDRVYWWWHLVNTAVNLQVYYNKRLLIS
jgi:hypothetical protein